MQHRISRTQSGRTRHHGGSHHEGTCGVDELVPWVRLPQGRKQQVQLTLLNRGIILIVIVHKLTTTVSTVQRAVVADIAKVATPVEVSVRPQIIAHAIVDSKLPGILRGAGNKSISGSPFPYDIKSSSMVGLAVRVNIALAGLSVELAGWTLIITVHIALVPELNA